MDSAWASRLAAIALTLVYAVPTAGAQPRTAAATERPAALLVLMENGGFTNGMPADAAIGLPLCGRFRIPSGTDLSELVAAAAAGLERSVSCVKRANWKPVSMPVTRYVAVITNRVIEDVGLSAINARAGDAYDRIVVLQDGDVTIDRIRRELTTLAPTHAIDIHVLAHGAPDSVSFRRRALRPRDIRGLASVPGLRLRSVYQQNCYGSSLADDWLAAGAGVVNGSDRINYMPLSYLSFLRRWTTGASFRRAVEDSSTDWVPYFRTVYRYVDLYNGTKARVPAVVDARGRLDPADELRESRMSVIGSEAGVTM